MRVRLHATSLPTLEFPLKRFARPSHGRRHPQEDSLKLINTAHLCLSPKGRARYWRRGVTFALCGMTVSRATNASEAEEGTHKSGFNDVYSHTLPNMPSLKVVTRSPKMRRNSSLSIEIADSRIFVREVGRTERKGRFHSQGHMPAGLQLSLAIFF